MFGRKDMIRENVQITECKVGDLISIRSGTCSTLPKYTTIMGELLKIKSIAPGMMQIKYRWGTKSKVLKANIPATTTVQRSRPAVRDPLDIDPPVLTRVDVREQLFPRTPPPEGIIPPVILDRTAGDEILRRVYEAMTEKHPPMIWPGNVIGGARIAPSPAFEVTDFIASEMEIGSSPPKGTVEVLDPLPSNSDERGLESHQLGKKAQYLPASTLGLILAAAMTRTVR